MVNANKFDVVVVGGGIGGSALATTLARAGIAVCVIEKSTEHLDRVRGEWISPWGVVETERLGLYELIRAHGAHHLGRNVGYSEEIDPAVARAEALDFSTFASAGLKGPLCMRHPDLCNWLNDSAREVGAVLIRGVSDVSVTPGDRPVVRYRHDNETVELHPRLIIGADGRGSAVRNQAGIELHRDPTHHLMTGMLVDDISGWPADVQIFGTEDDINFLVFPQSETRARLYICYGIDQKRRFAGLDNQQRFLDAFRLRCVPESEYLVRGTPAGPCNSYGNEDSWTDSPVAPGVVLVGDAAGHNDPIIGQGLSITFRDARIVRDLMVESRDWSADSFRPYADERRERMRRLRFTAAWFSVAAAEFGPAASERRKRIREARLAGRLIDLGAVAFIGPDLAPPEAFEPSVMDALRAV
jgi:2-polyprenyl-6-methoxyphenol hydroxylase-like FAD-dependent oxidoreductase